MKFCEDCFSDDIIKMWIRKNGEDGECHYCTGKNKKVISLEIERLKDYFGALLDIYIPIEKIEGYSISEGELLKTIIKKEWNIFNKKMPEASIERILRFILPEKEELYSTKVAIPIKREHEEISILRNSSWDEFVKEIKRENRFHTKIFNKDNFEYFLSKLSIKIEKEKILYRGRLSTEEGYAIEEMGAPPEGKASGGRVNPDGISCLYLAEDKDTIFQEMRVLKNDFITIGKFELEKDIVIVDLTRIDKLSPFLDLDEILNHGINQKHLNEIAKEISRPQNRYNNSLDYLPSQYIAEHIKSLGFAGIKYKSTVRKKGINYAIFDETNFICKEVKVYQIKDVACQSEELEND